MKLTKYLLLVPALALTVSFANAKEIMQKQYKAPIEEECVFRDYEFQLSGFIAGLAACRNRTIPPGFGGGLGASYYFLRYFGVGLEAWWTGSRGHYTEQNFSGIFYMRYPICSWYLAPYALIGGGVNCDGRNYGNFQVGGGFEWRPWRHLGFFVDGRAIIPSRANTFALIRGGINIVF
jgi:hypothetical protein